MRRAERVDLQHFGGKMAPVTKEEAIAWFVEVRDSRSALTKSVPQDVRLALAAMTPAEWESLGYREGDALAMVASLEHADAKSFSRIVGIPVEFKKK